MTKLLFWLVKLPTPIVLIGVVALFTYFIYVNLHSEWEVIAYFGSVPIYKRKGDKR